MAQAELEPIENFIFKGLQQRLIEVFAAPVVMVNATDEIQALRKIREKGVTYPYLFLSITGMAETKDSYRSMPFIRRGMDIVLSTDRKVAKKVAIMPTDVTFEVSYRHNSFPDVIEFGKRWLFAARGGYLKFTIEYGKSFDIHIYLSEELQIPKREANPENVTEYIVLTSLTVKGWFSEKKIREQQMALEVNVDAYISEMIDKQKGLPQVGDIKTMTFKRTQDAVTVTSED